MSRGVEGRTVAWQVWMTFHTSERTGPPVAYEHQCGSLGSIRDADNYAEMMCPGCRFELARPEDECTPLYGRKEGS